MTVFQFLNNRQLGISRDVYRASNSTLNFDNVLSRFACRKEDIFTVRGEESDVPPFACKFRRDNQCDLLAVANEDGDIALYNTSEKTQDTLLKSFTAHHNAIFDICWLPDKCQLVSGSGDHNAALWDITHCKLISIFKKHTASIKTVDVCHEQSALFATGSRDGTINMWDTRANGGTIQSKPVISISQAHCRKNIAPSGKKTGQKDPISSVSSVVFQDCNNLASAGVADGMVKIWDLRKTYVANSKFLPSPKYQLNYSESKTTGPGCTSLVFDSLYKNLYGCSTSNKIFRFDCHSYSKEVVTWYEGFRCATYFVKLALSSDDQYLLCGSSDDKAYIWKVSKPGLPILQLPGHSAEVTSVCWSSYDLTKLATCGDDNKVAIWRIANAETVSINEDLHAVVEPFTDSSKNVSPPTPTTDQNSFITSNTDKRSPAEISQTPSRQSPRVITNFFSPVTSLILQTPMKDIQNQITSNSSEVSSPVHKLSNVKSTTVSVSAQVLTPSNLVNKKNIMKHSPNDILETQSSPEDKNSTPNNKISGTSILTSSSSIQNKENSSTDLSPETVNKPHAGLVKRKTTTNHSTPNLKRKAIDSSNKSKRPAKAAKKAVAVGRTIMNYFSVVLSPDD